MISIKEGLELYINDPEKRIKKNINNNKQFVNELIQIYTEQNQNKDQNMNQNIDKDTVIKFITLFMIEELRRYKIKLVNVDTIDDYILRILNIDHSTIIKNTIQNIKHKYFENVSMVEYFENRIKANFNIELDEYNIDYNNLSIDAQKLFVLNKEIIKRNILPILNTIIQISYSHINIDSLSSLGIETNEQFMAIIIQNLKNISEKRILKSINKSNYNNPIVNPSKYIKSVVDKIILKKLKLNIDILTDEKYDFPIHNVIKLFRYTKNSNVVAGILKGLSHESLLFSKIIKILCTRDCKIVKTKLNIIHTCVYKDLILLLDENNFISEWKPESNILKKLILNNQDKITKMEWIQMFPDKLRIILHIYNQFI